MPIKIAIGIPTQGEIKAKTALSIIETVRLNDYEFLPVFQYGNYINDSRERIVEIAKSQLCSHIFFVDADMRFSHNTVKRLIEHNKDIIGASYNYRGLPPVSTTKFFDEEKGLCKVAGIGTGCLLIKMNVFKEIEKPYFPIELTGEGLLKVTEDIGFCEKARDKGLDVWCDTDILIKHIGDFEF